MCEIAGTISILIATSATRRQIHRSSHGGGLMIDHNDSGYDITCKFWNDGWGCTLLPIERSIHTLISNSISRLIERFAGAHEFGLKLSVNWLYLDY